MESVDHGERQIQIDATQSGGTISVLILCHALQSTPLRPALHPAAPARLQEDAGAQPSQASAAPSPL